MPRKSVRQYEEREGFKKGVPFMLKYDGYTVRYTPIRLHETSMECQRELIEDGEVINTGVYTGVTYDIKESRFYDT